MKIKHGLTIIFLMSALMIGGCNNNQSSSQESSAPQSSSEASQSSSEAISSSSERGSDSSEAKSSTSSSSLPPEPTYLKKDITVQLDPGLRAGEDADKTPYDLTFAYDDEFFLKSAKTYDENLSMLSFGASIATTNKTRGDAFYNAAGFKDITTHDYDKTPTKDTMGYYLAHKTIDDYELVTVAFRGFEYGLEWANNFLIGKTGDHEGFATRGVEAYQDLQNYLAKYCANKTLKLWINGYSRAGALSQVLSSLILKGDKVNVTAENMFVYTFEAPAGLLEENAVAYENVHSIVNDGDLVAAIPPASYGLKRCGVEHQIYDINVATMMKEFDAKIEIPEFKVLDGLDTESPLETDPQVRAFVINSVFNKEVSDSVPENAYANTREQYVDNYQEGLSNALGYIFGLTAATRSQLMTDLMNKNVFELMGIIFDETGEGLADFLSPYLVQDNITFDSEALQSDCAVVAKGAMNLFMQVLLMYASNDYKGSLVRLIDMHYPEVTYVLLNNMHNKKNTNQA